MQVLRYYLSIIAKVKSWPMFLALACVKDFLSISPATFRQFITSNHWIKSDKPGGDRKPKRFLLVPIWRFSGESEFEGKLVRVTAGRTLRRQGANMLCRCWGPIMVMALARFRLFSLHDSTQQTSSSWFEFDISLDDVIVQIKNGRWFATWTIQPLFGAMKKTAVSLISNHTRISVSNHLHSALLCGKGLE